MISYAHQKKIEPLFISTFCASISPLNDLISFFKIYFILRRIKPDIVHTHTFKAGLLGRIAAFFAQVPIRVHTYHGHLLNSYWSGWKLWTLKTIERNLGRITDACIGVSPKVSEDLIVAKVISREKMKTVILGFDFDYLKHEKNSPSTIRKQLAIPQTDFVFGTACRLVPIKNLSLLIEAGIPILISHPQSRLIIVGRGPEKEKLISLVQKLTESDQTLKSRIYFLDWIVPFQREYKDFDLYICSSLNEGTSVSVIEALVAEVPVISTAVGGMPDLLLDGKLGELVQTKSPSELTAAIERHIKQLSSIEIKNRLKQISLEIEKKFSEQTLAEKTYQLYKDLLRLKGIA